MANSILSLRLSTNKDMADSLANLDLGGLAEGVPDEAVVVPLTELDMVVWKELICQGLVGQLPTGDSFEVGPFEISTTPPKPTLTFEPFGLSER
jgi:hypothetical protein